MCCSSWATAGSVCYLQKQEIFRSFSAWWQAKFLTLLYVVFIWNAAWLSSMFVIVFLWWQWGRTSEHWSQWFICSALQVHKATCGEWADRSGIGNTTPLFSADRKLRRLCTNQDLHYPSLNDVVWDVTLLKNYLSHCGMNTPLLSVSKDV